MVEPQIVVLVVAGSSPVGHPAPRIQISGLKLTDFGLKRFHLAKAPRKLLLVTKRPRSLDKTWVAQLLPYAITSLLAKCYKIVIFLLTQHFISVISRAMVTNHSGTWRCSAHSRSLQQLLMARSLRDLDSASRRKATQQRRKRRKQDRSLLRVKPLRLRRLTTISGRCGNTSCLKYRARQSQSRKKRR